MKTKRTFTLTRTIILALTLSLCVGLAFPAYAAPLEIIPSITINIPGVSSIRATFTNVYAYYEDGIVSEADIDDTTDEAEMPKVGDKYCSFTFESGGLLATQYPELGGSVAPPGYDTLKKGAATFSEDIILMQGYGNTAVSPTGEVIAESFRIVSETVKKGEVLEEPEGYFKCKTDDGETLWVVLFGRDPRNGIDNFVHPLSDLAVASPTAPAEQPSSWAAEQVNGAIELGIVPQSLRSGYTQTITRAEYCALAVTLYEKYTGGEITERVSFDDTNDVNVEKMAAVGVVSGIGDDLFAPNNELTREQAATMLARLADAIGKPLEKKAASFADNAAISSWAIENVGQVQGANIMGGIGNNTFAPKSPYTREQSILTMMRLWDVV